MNAFQGEGRAGVGSRLLLGGIAGVLATLPQSGVVWGMRRAGVYQRRPPPEVIVEDLTSKTGSPPPGPARSAPVKLAAHFGFGAAGGAGYGLLTSVVPVHPLTGVLTGLGIWKGSYDGWIPALGIMPPPEEDEQGRVVTMVLAHVAYGLALALVLRRLLPERSSASRR